MMVDVLKSAFAELSKAGGRAPENVGGLPVCR